MGGQASKSDKIMSGLVWPLTRLRAGAVAQTIVDRKVALSCGLGRFMKHNGLSQEGHSVRKTQSKAPRLGWCPIQSAPPQSQSLSGAQDIR